MSRREDTATAARLLFCQTSMPVDVAITARPLFCQTSIPVDVGRRF